MKKAANDSLVILILYLDDMLLANRHSYELDAIWAKLHEAFDMEDLGDAFDFMKHLGRIYTLNTYDLLLRYNVQTYPPVGILLLHQCII